jgi:hypothetical protein
LISHHHTKKPIAFIQGHNSGSSLPFGLGRIQVRQLLSPQLLLVLMLAVEVLELLVRGQAIPVTDLLLLTLLIFAVFS